MFPEIGPVLVLFGALELLDEELEGAYKHFAAEGVGDADGLELVAEAELDGGMGVFSVCVGRGDVEVGEFGERPEADFIEVGADDVELGDDEPTAQGGLVPEDHVAKQEGLCCGDHNGGCGEEIDAFVFPEGR